MAKKYIVALLSLACVAQANAQDERKLGFIDANLEDFVNRVSTQDEERNQFKVYYSHLIQKIQEAKEKEPAKERATYRYLYNLALENLKTKHADWYKEIDPFVSNPVLTLDDNLNEVRNVIKHFLTRYGAYEEFLNFRAAKQLEQATMLAQESQGGIWHTIKGYATAAKDKVAGLFGFTKSEEKVA